MNIKIELNDYRCEQLLKMYGYITKEITAYYHATRDPYNMLDDDIKDLKGIKIVVAYPEHEKPEEMDKEYPMLDVMKEYLYPNVINNLFSERVCEVLFGN